MLHFRNVHAHHINDQSKFQMNKADLYLDSASHGPIKSQTMHKTDNEAQLKTQIGT